jgi:hypothetical protein
VGSTEPPFQTVCPVEHNKKNAETIRPIHTFITLNMPSTFTAHKPLAFEPSPSMMSECQCVGRVMVCNESRAQTWLSCSVSETNKGSVGLCKNCQYVSQYITL